MTNSETTAQVYFSNGSSQIYNLDATDATEGELLELVSGAGIGTAAQSLTVVGLTVSCENQVEYIVLLDELGTMQFSSGGCRPEAGSQPHFSPIPSRTIGLNWALKVLTAAS